MKIHWSVYSLSLVVLSLVFFNSCKKDDKDTLNPVLTLSEPTAGDTLLMSVSDSVDIKFLLSDNDVITDVSVNIADAWGSNVYSDAFAANTATYSYHEYFVPANISGLTSFTLTINATDASSNSISKPVQFYVAP